MTFTTVGEVLDALKDIDRSMPVLIADPLGDGYYDANVGGILKYRVVPVIKLEENDLNYYIDAPESHVHSFDAIVL